MRCCPKPEVNAAINAIYQDITKAKSEYSDACAKRNKQIKQKESDPSVTVDPVPDKPAVVNMDSEFFDTWRSSNKSNEYKFRKAFADSLDPEAAIYNKELDAVGQKEIVEQREAEIARAKTPFKFRETTAALDTNIESAKTANKVFIRHNDYDSALTAMEELKKASRKYAETTEKHKDSNKLIQDAAKKIQETAKDAQKKIETYLARKAKDGKLNQNIRSIDQRNLSAGPH